MVKYENDNAKQKHKMAPFYFNIEKDTTQDYLIITSFPPAERYLKSKIKKEHLIYSSPALGATVAPNDNSVSRPASNTVGAGQDVRPTSDKSSVPSTSNVAQGQEEVNGVDNAKLVPYRDAVARIMSQAGRDKSYLSKEDKKEAPVNASGEGYDSSTATTATPTLTRRNGETDASSMSSVEQGQEEVNGVDNAKLFRAVEIVTCACVIYSVLNSVF